MGNGCDRPRGAALQKAPRQAPADGTFDSFYAQQYTPLVQFFRRRNWTEHEAEDVAQESLTRFLPYVERQPQVAWGPTLYRIALNLVNERFRRLRARQAHAHVPLEDLELDSGEPGLDERAELAQQQARLREVVRTLPPQCQRVYLLRFVHGMTNAEVARRCGISVRMVEKHQANALLYLGRRLGRGASGACWEEKA